MPHLDEVLVTCLVSGTLVGDFWRGSQSDFHKGKPQLGRKNFPYLGQFGHVFDDSLASCILREGDFEAGLP